MVSGMAPNEKLRVWREKAKLTISEVARRANVKPSTISRIESGESIPLIALAAKLAKITEGKVPVTAWVPKDSAA